MVVVGVLVVVVVGVVVVVVVVAALRVDQMTWLRNLCALTENVACRWSLPV